MSVILKKKKTIFRREENKQNKIHIYIFFSVYVFSLTLSVSFYPRICAHVFYSGFRSRRQWQQQQQQRQKGTPDESRITFPRPRNDNPVRVLCTMYAVSVGVFYFNSFFFFPKRQNIITRPTHTVINIIIPYFFFSVRFVSVQFIVLIKFLLFFSFVTRAFFSHFFSNIYILLLLLQHTRFSIVGRCVSIRIRRAIRPCRI